MSVQRQPEVIEQVVKLHLDDYTPTEITKKLEVPRTTVRDIISDYKDGVLEVLEHGILRRGQLFPFPQSPQTAKDRLIQDSLNPPSSDMDDKETIRRLEGEVARLQQQLTWAQHAESKERTGGVLTLRRSDDHHGDKNHLLSCAASMQEKFLVLVEQYEPDRVQIIGWDDWIAGRGIYKEQDLDAATSDVDEQVAIGAVKTRHFIEAVRGVTDAPIEGHFLRGNHEYAHGVSMAESLFYRCRAATDDIPEVKLVYHWDNATINLAAEGTYNVLVRHGFGYSKHSPNSPAFIEAVKDELLVKQRIMQPEEQYRRVLSGHSHWSSCGIERVHGLFFDTTGGLQRNTRVRLGDNQRPVGWLVYVSPRGLKDEILRPIEITPDEAKYQREIANPYLAAENLLDAGNCVKEFQELMRNSGAVADATSFGKLNEGRW